MTTTLTSSNSQVSFNIDKALDNVVVGVSYVSCLPHEISCCGWPLRWVTGLVGNDYVSAACGVCATQFYRKIKKTVYLDEDGNVI